MFSFSLLTPPSAEPVSLDEAKAHLRLGTTDDDAFVSNLIKAARMWAERYTGRSFMTQTWQLALDGLPDASMDWWDNDPTSPLLGLNAARFLSLPRAPLQSVTSVEIFDDNDTATTWAASHYFVDTHREPGRLVLRSGASWPMPTRPANGIVVTYVAGYGDDAMSVPEPIRAAIRERVAHGYAHRGDEEPTVLSRGSFAAEALLDPYRLRFTGI